MGRWGDGEMRRWGDGEMGRWRDGDFIKIVGQFQNYLIHYYENPYDNQAIWHCHF
ncbi:MAG: hypothetical protein F6K26_08880 [Moorea sp. SIO2I5]|nr:hypothetical protein [Moorena sp. SIO2I5]